MTSSFVNYKINGSSPQLVLQLPKVFAPFGASTFDTSIPMPKFNVMLSLGGDEEKMEPVQKFFEDLENLVLETAINNKSWNEHFQKKLGVNEFHIPRGRHRRHHRPERRRQDHVIPYDYRY